MSNEVRREDLSRFLDLCSCKYSSMVEELHRFRDTASPELLLTWVELIAEFAAMNHPGLFADGRLENVALEIGRSLPRSSPANPSPLIAARRPERRNCRRVVHIATVVTTVGGVVRTIINWIRKDPESVHSIILTRQGRTPIPPHFVNGGENSGGQIYAFADDVPLSERALWLRKVAPRCGDMAFLHLVPYDVVPIAAFAEETQIPVSLVNVADQCFWIGSTVADATVNLRLISIDANREVRYTRNDLHLPIPLVDDPTEMQRDEARQSIGIPKAQKMFLTVGRPIKYAPSRRCNFYRTARKLLDEHPDAQLYFVGLDPKEQARSDELRDHNRAHFVGHVLHPMPYQASADVYLEGFPFGSQTALLEGVLPGVPCVRSILPQSPLLAASDVAIDEICPAPPDERSYIDEASRLAEHSEASIRLGQMLRQRVRKYHIEDWWNDALEDIYHTISGLPHTTSEIPDSFPAQRVVDQAISEYHESRISGEDCERAVNQTVREVVLGAAYSLRERGVHKDAFTLLRSSAYGYFDRKALSFSAKLAPHWAWRTLKRI